MPSEINGTYQKHVLSNFLYNHNKTFELEELLRTYIVLIYFENMTQSDVKQALLYVVVNKNMTFCSDIANRDDD